MNANDEMLSGNANADASYLDSILMLVNLNAGYADSDADLCIRICAVSGYIYP